MIRKLKLEEEKNYELGAELNPAFYANIPRKIRDNLKDDIYKRLKSGKVKKGEKFLIHPSHQILYSAWVAEYIGQDKRGDYEFKTKNGIMSLFEFNNTGDMIIPYDFWIYAKFHKKTHNYLGQL